MGSRAARGRPAAQLAERFADNYPLASGTTVPSFSHLFGSVAVLQLWPSRQSRLLVWQRSRGARPGSIPGVASSFSREMLNAATTFGQDPWPRMGEGKDQGGAGVWGGGRSRWGNIILFNYKCPLGLKPCCDGNQKNPGWLGPKEGGEKIKGELRGGGKRSRGGKAESYPW